MFQCFLCFVRTQQDTPSSCSLLLTISARESEQRCVMHVCVRCYFTEHRALRFHEIVCIRKVRKTKCYVLKSCDPVLTSSMGRIDSLPQACKS